MSTKKMNIFGFKFLTPIKEATWSSDISVPAGILMDYDEANCNATITLEDGPTGYDNQWLFAITQGATAYSVTLPEIKWPLGIAPSFSANTTTEIRLCYRNGVLTGMWSPC